MGVVSADIKRRLSTQSGAAGNSTASTPAASFGKYMSTTDIVTATLENLFINITAAEGAAGKTVYRCIFFYNSHATVAWDSIKIWITSQTAGGGDVSIGLDPTGKTANNSASAQAKVPADDTTAPADVVFSTPTNEADALDASSCPATQCFALWLKLVVPADVESLALDSITIKAKGQSDP